MKVCFRVDASVDIGSGHVMRCLALAAALRLGGADCHFICRDLPGHLTGAVRQHGFEATLLKPAGASFGGAPAPAHAAWLGCRWQDDAAEVAPLLAVLQADWLVVDHYALDARWESMLRRDSMRLMVIDDLADRAHDCDVLLDQNLGRTAAHYRDLLAPHCPVLAGPAYALLRPEFGALRRHSLARREGAELARVLVNMGGVDQFNATAAVLQALARSDLAQQCAISVIMGLNAPWIGAIRTLAANAARPIEVAVNVSDMALRMAESDLAIGAAGSTSWERCCLGLPTLVVVLAPNQAGGAAALEHAGAALALGTPAQIGARLPAALRHMGEGGALAAMSMAARALVDGLGVGRVLAAMREVP
ncbi:UDP-2,4-diacetamido-2,4,6-trideoxy-beta-L-altropyranose hydrolase [Massilia sp. TWP1-3-3]|uniref:UDP-2,4-diacetamido-2,4, 6-trideoxy-beta-L-altropyranose hydrolase n=1 Tax=Massilia sp. TWP1-3-3 TaxID=2804573 RepID=UPI003CF1779E